MTFPAQPGSASAGARVWVGIPVYNNSRTIHDVASRARAIIAQVIVIDDGSTDADLRELLGGLDVAVVRHPINRGKGAALLTAFEYARAHGGEYLISLDGDGQHLPEDLPAFVSLLAPDAILLGHREQVSGLMPRSSRFGREFSDFWLGLETGARLRDTQSGYRAYPLAAIMQLPLRSDRYHFEMEVLARALWAGLRVESVPIRVHYDPPGQRVSSFDPLRDNLRIAWLHTRLILRQLLPWPHRRARAAAAAGASRSRSARFLPRDYTAPAALALAAGLTLVLGIVLWPWGALVAIYLASRLHLSKPIVLLCAAAAMLPIVPNSSRAIGERIADSPALEWFVGSHIVAFTLAIPIAAIAFAAGRWFQARARREASGVDSGRK
jgi:glycosyltransferase involved in cell wall biosynthesis